MDELRLRITTNKRIMDCNLLIFTETWLNPPIPDNAINLAEQIGRPTRARAKYSPLIRRVKPTVRIVKIWPEGAEAKLQECFKNHDWSKHSSEATLDSHPDITLLHLLCSGLHEILVNFYRSTIESILTNCVTVWYGNCSASDRKALQRVVKIAQRITGSPLPSIEAVQRKRCLRKARSIAKDNSHPNHRLFTLLPSGKRYRSLGTRTSRFRGSFFPQAVTLLSSTPI
ncbi:hypothetical protein N1851_030137 [Merluccius polli]|uniref:Uncharacterized protein n=1 Tax=Merluccius polli TaxID=89951 RepID=A0AA47NQB2_MERPO|nr:hypothetical protein N1851_030137 [Merluccius polli]